MEKITPITLTNADTGKTYTLEFNRRTCALAENAGITLPTLTEEHKIMSVYPELFYHAFLMHHPQTKKAETDRILFDDLGGFTPELMTRLVELFAQPYNTLVKQEEDAPKNAKWSVAL